MATQNVIPVLVTFDTAATAQNRIPKLISLTPADSLLGTASINGKATGQTTLLTVPAGKRCIPTKMMLVMTSASNVTGVAQVSIGTAGAGYDQVIANTTLTNFDATGESWTDIVAEGLIAVTANPAATSTVSFSVNVAATTTGAGDTYTFTAYLFGLLV